MENVVVWVEAEGSRGPKREDDPAQLMVAVILIHLEVIETLPNISRKRTVMGFYPK